MWRHDSCQTNSCGKVKWCYRRCLGTQKDALKDPVVQGPGISWVFVNENTNGPVNFDKLGSFV